MNRRHQRGVLLLSVVIILAVIGALAFAMSREGAMSAQMVDAQNDTEVARYLAEAGLNLAKWRYEKSGCSTSLILAKTTLPGIGIGTFSANVSQQNSGTVTIVATGNSIRGASFKIVRNYVILQCPLFGVSLPAGGDASDTNLSGGLPASLNGMLQLELIQGQSALIQFSLLDIPAGSRIVTANLTLVQMSSNSTQPAQVVSVHRVLRGWDAQTATWTLAALLTPWSSAGGDYDAGTVALATISGNAQYSWDVAALLDGWVNRTIPNYGLSLQPDGPLQQARFSSFENPADSKPVIDVTFAPPC